MKIIFLNIWNCTNKDSLMEFIKQHAQATDVFCLQEVREEAKCLFRDVLLNYNIVAGNKHLTAIGDFSEATFVKKDINILSKEVLLLDVPGTGLALYTQIQIRNSNIYVCNVHGISEPGNKLDNIGRLRQSREVIERFSSLRGLKVIGGDFNLEINTISVKMFEENGYRNLIRDYKIPTTRNKFAWDRFPGDKRYFSDYVFINREVNVREFSVPDLEISDHLPMILTLDL